jgi:hypothetical protein
MQIRQQAAAGPSSQTQSGQSADRVYSVQIPPGYTFSTIVFSNGTGGTSQQHFVPAPGADQNHGPGAPDKPAADASDGTGPPSNIYLYIPISVPPRPYVAELRQGNAGDEGGRWTEPELLYLAALERRVQLEHEEKGRAFWKAWVEVRWSGLCGTCQDGAARGLVEEKLKRYSWYSGDATVDEAINAMRNISEIDRALMATMALMGNQAEGEKEGEEGKQKESE